LTQNYALFTGRVSKFTGESGRITLEGHRDERGVEMSVTDTGVGMTPDRLGRLFGLEKENTTLGTKGEKGTGLGLLLCKDLIEKNKGSIRVESEVGQGTTFTIAMPPA